MKKHCRHLSTGLACLALSALSLSFTGCDQLAQVAQAEESASEWLNGTWAFDEAFTEAHWKKVRSEHDAKESGLQQMVDEVKHWGEETAAPWILSGEKGKKLKFNGVERISMVGDKGKAEGYLVMDAPHQHEATLQFVDGTIITYKLVGGHLRVPFESKFANYVFYRRVD